MLQVSLGFGVYGLWRVFQHWGFFVLRRAVQANPDILAPMLQVGIRGGWAVGFYNECVRVWVIACMGSVLGKVSEVTVATAAAAPA
jgi:hypothetical protein